MALHCNDVNTYSYTLYRMVLHCNDVKHKTMIATIYLDMRCA